MPDTVTSSSGTSSLTDAIGIGTLTRLVPRELVDEVVASVGRTEIRRNKLPARVMVYFVMAMALFYGDSYEEVMRKLADGLGYMATWRKDWGNSRPGSPVSCPAETRREGNAGAVRARGGAVRVAVDESGVAGRAAPDGGRRLRHGSPGQGGERRVLRVRGKERPERVSLWTHGCRDGLRHARDNPRGDR